jgi:hypothetical protein
VTTRLVAAALFLFTVAISAQQPPFDGKTLWRHVEVLAADDMEGRAPGSAGLVRAEAYVVDQLKAIGLAPAGTNGYFQPLTLVRRKVIEADSNVALVREGRVQPLTIGEHASILNDIDAASTVDAPLIFLGYGLRIPSKHYDDFAGLDLKGKIAVTVPGTPEGIEPDLAVQLAQPATRWQQFRDAGMIGWVEIAAPEASWTFIRDANMTTTLSLAGDQFSDGKGQQIHVLFNPAHADLLLDGTGHSAKELFALGQAYRPLPRFPLKARLRATTRMSRTILNSSNVIARLDGDDPVLRHEYVVLSAHIDHLGIREPVNGDRIYNGAVDNASGVAALLDIAQSLKREGVRPKRSVLFAFVTAEEDGKLGSRYFAARPTVNRGSIVADLNIDGIQAVVPLKALQVLGAEESDLGQVARRIAAEHHVDIEGDIEFQAGRFATGSDQGSFAFAGIPAVKLNVGFPGDLAAVQQKWRREHYHTPFDDAQQPINFESIARYEEIARDLLLAVANAPRRPAWKPGSVYERYAR